MEAINETLARRGERVLAFAQLTLPLDTYPHGYAFDQDSNPPNYPTSGLTLVESHRPLDMLHWCLM